MNGICIWGGLAAESIVSGMKQGSPIDENRSGGVVALILQTAADREHFYSGRSECLFGSADESKPR